MSPTSGPAVSARRSIPRVCFAAAVIAAALVAAGGAIQGAGAAAATPISHVVIIEEENHSFDDIFGKFCVEQEAGQIHRSGLNQRCDGTDRGTLPDGSTMSLRLQQDFGLNIDHSVRSQQRAIDGGAMDGFSLIDGCQATSNVPYGCLSQFDPLNGTCGTSGTNNCLPNLDAYAKKFTLSDRTFELRASPSWAGHMILGSATIQHFRGENPVKRKGDPGGPGWGCDAGRTTQWYLAGRSGASVNIPSCVPDQLGSLGPTWADYSGVKAAYVPTIFDRMDATGVSWKIYGGGGATSRVSGYSWQVCPTFWECLGSAQSSHLVSNLTFTHDVSGGALPAVSLVTPATSKSAHQPASVSQGDAWVGKLVSAVMKSQDWSSTAIFITFDDCGCFYDHVNPLQYSADWGVRLPVLIVSPYAKAGYTDSEPATPASMLAFLEHNFGLAPLSPCATVDSWDPNCTDDVRGLGGPPTYDYSSSFDFSQPPLPPIPARTVRVPAAEAAWLAAHPDAGDEAT